MVVVTRWKTNDVAVVMAATRDSLSQRLSRATDAGATKKAGNMKGKPAYGVS